MTRTAARCWLIDLDGVLIHDERVIPGAAQFLAHLASAEIPHMVITNNSLYTPEQMCARVGDMGLSITPSHLWTSALATARFLATHRPGSSVYAMGAVAVHDALADAGARVDERAPDVVVLGEVQEYSFDEITKVVRLIAGGAAFVATNPEPTGPSRDGPLPACGALAALVARATGVEPFFVGKPSTLMLSQALAMLGASPDTAAIVGDRMETDVVAGVSLGLETVLALSGVTARDAMSRYVIQPTRVVDSVAELVDELSLPDAGV